MRHIRLGTALLVTAALVVSACGSDDEGDGGDAGTTSLAQPSGTAGAGSVAPDGTGDEQPPGTPTTAGSPTTGSAAPTDSGGEPQTGGTLRFIMTFEPASFDPIGLRATASGGFLNQAYALYGALLTQNQATRELEYGIAESLTTDDEGTTWVLKLRDGVEFSDGTPYDAEAVNAHWTRSADPEGRATGLPLMSTIESVSVTDPLTLTIVLAQPNTLFARGLAASSLSYVPSPTAIETLGADFGVKPVGAGPFVLEKWTPNSQTVMVRNPNYWDAPRPYVDELIFRPLTDEGQGQNSYAADEADVFYTIAGTRADELAEQGSQVYEARQLQGSGLLMTSNKAPLDDVNLRRAIAMALDLQRINEIIYGQDNPPSTLFAPDSPYYAADATYPAHDPDAARALVDEHKQTAGTDSVTVAMAIVAGVPSQQQLAELVQADLAAVGIELTITPLDFAALARERGNFDLNTQAVSGVFPDPAMFDFYHSNGFLNFTKYSNPDVDAALERARSTSDEAEQLAAFAEAQAILAEDVPYLPTRYSTYYLVHKDDVHGVQAIEDVALRTDLVWIEQ